MENSNSLTTTSNASLRPVVSLSTTGFLRRAVNAINPFHMPFKRISPKVIDEPFPGSPPGTSMIAHQSMQAETFMKEAFYRVQALEYYEGSLAVIVMPLLIVFPVFFACMAHGSWELATTASIFAAFFSWISIRFSLGTLLFQDSRKLRDTVKAKSWDNIFLRALDSARNAGLNMDKDLLNLRLLLSRPDAFERARRVPVEDVGALADVAQAIENRVRVPVRVGDSISVSGVTSEMLSRVIEAMSEDVGPRDLKV